MNTGRKYEFTGETKLYNGVTLHQIRAVSTSLIYYEGAIGGWIQSERNLSHDGTAWIHSDTHVYGDVVVKGSSNIKNSEISGEGVIDGSVSIFDSTIQGKFNISGYLLMTNSELYGRTILNDGKGQINNSKIGNLQVVGKEFVSIDDSVLAFDIGRIVISKTFTVLSSNIRFSECVIEGDTVLNHVNLLENLDLIVKDTFHMEWVKSSTSNRIRVNNSKDVKTAMRGNKEEPIHLERGYLVLHNSLFQDSCFISGGWSVFDSWFENSITLDNKSPLRLTMRNCSLKESSSIVAHSGGFTFTPSKIPEIVSVHLSGDDVFSTS